MTRRLPYRPVTPVLASVRGIVHKMRYFRHKVVLGRKLRTGRNFTIGSGAVLLPPEFAHFDENVGIGRGFHLETNVSVGPNVLISSNVALVGNDHAFDDPGVTVFEGARNPPATVELEGDNLIGFGVTIIGSVRVGKGCIVGARSVVTRDLPPYTVCVGVPARPVRSRFPVDANKDTSLLSPAA